jgi:hypothetical protein
VEDQRAVGVDARDLEADVGPSGKRSPAASPCVRDDLVGGPAVVAVEVAVVSLEPRAA